MKRRLNILCVIVVLVLSYSVFETGYYFIVGVKAGVEAGIDGNASEASQKKLMNMKYISLIASRFSPHQTIKIVKIIISTVQMSEPSNPKAPPFSTLSSGRCKVSIEDMKLLTLTS